MPLPGSPTQPFDSLDEVITYVNTYIFPNTNRDITEQQVNNIFNGIISTLRATIPAGTHSFLLKANQLLETILIIEATNITVDIGTTSGGHDIYQGFNITGGAQSLGLSYFALVDTTIYVSNLTSNSTMNIYKR